MFVIGNIAFAGAVAITRALRQLPPELNGFVRASGYARSRPRPLGRPPTSRRQSQHAAYRRRLVFGLRPALVPISILGRHERVPDREFVVFLESMAGLMTIDGRAFIGNTPVFHARVGDVVQWDVLTLGDDHHTFHVHGHRWLEHGTPVDVQTVGPAESFKIRWREDRPGTWYYHCHVEGHMANGMIGLYRVSRR